MQKTCSQCSASFEITDGDLAFYEKVSPVIGGKKFLIPPPTLCPDCRQQRRLGFRNERRLYRRKCDFTGKPIIALFAPDAPYPVYGHASWYSDAWDPLEYGREFDFSTPFFDQLDALWKRVPQLAIFNTRNENSEYATYSEQDKNCYLLSASNRNEDCYYSSYIWDSISCCDCHNVEKAELCYEAVDCSGTYNVRHSQNCHDCRDCSLCYDCRSCHDLYACSGLRSKQYCILNEQYSPEEYKKKIKELPTQEVYEKFQKLKLRTPRLFANLLHCEDVSGDYLTSCSRADHCFNSFDLQDAKFVENSPGGSRDVMDISGCTHTQFAYELVSVAYGYEVSWCITSHIGLKNSLYCVSCHSGNNLFGCIGMKKGQYCLLNKQYGKEEYEKLVPKVIAHMQSTKEWGEFFPLCLSPFAYNETVAQEYFPLSKQEAASRDSNWRDTVDEMPEVKKTIPAAKLPDSIESIPDDILNWAITCETTKRPFRIIKQELEFYRKMKLPIPHFHPDERHKRRMALRNPRILWQRKCAKCRKEIQTTYAPERPERVYCEECYLKEVY